MTGDSAGGPPPALFTFSGVEVTRGGVLALRGVDATVPATGITVVVGPSGSGKSTLLRLCNRLEVASAGAVTFLGEPIADAEPRALRRRVGMVFQRPTVFEGTVRDNLQVATPGVSDEDAVASLRRADLDASFLDRDASALSGGEAQRVCLARTLVTQPEAMLLDEPTSALDPGSRRALEVVARRLADGGVPMVWVTHDLDQARRLADHVVVLIAGRTADEGDLADVEARADGEVLRFLEGETSAEVGSAEGVDRA